MKFGKIKLVKSPETQKDEHEETWLVNHLLQVHKLRTDKCVIQNFVECKHTQVTFSTVQGYLCTGMMCTGLQHVLRHHKTEHPLAKGQIYTESD